MIRSDTGDIIFTATNDVDKDTTTFRIKASIPFYFSLPIAASEDDISSVVTSEINDLCDKIRSTSSYFKVSGTSTFLHGIDDNEQTFVEFGASDTVATLLNTVDKKTRKKIKDDLFRNVFQVQYYQKLTIPICCESSKTPFSPIIRYDVDTFQRVSLNLHLDVLCVVENTTPMSELSGVFSGSFCEQLRAIQFTLLNYMNVDECSQKTNVKIYQPEVFHFLPEGYNYFITAVYPYTISESLTEKHRKCIHEALNISMDKPLFRRGSVFPFELLTPEGYLINPHLSIPVQKMGGKGVSLVSGHYSYHHYMQDKFDDNKWGCAYRSLQTLVSWFRMQGYSAVDIPSHTTIQQTLVDLGDKPASFVGSTQWIGSVEVGLCLDKLIGVKSKFINVNSGSEIEDKGRELAHHFQKQGTPIMIGGGVLAHTILGVDFDESSGSTRFLILDPHYTGDENVSTIVDKGWCGWKKSAFWSKTSMYNMCLPQRPCIT